VVTAVLSGGALLSGCGASSQPTAAELTACGTVNSMAAGVFVTTLLTYAEQLQASADAQSSSRVAAALKSLEATCTELGVGPSDGGI
jgi:hypothetical protein